MGRTTDFRMHKPADPTPEPTEVTTTGDFDADAFARAAREDAEKAVDEALSARPPEPPGAATKGPKKGKDGPAHA